MPISHPFVERLVRIVRNEVLDRTLFWTATDLQAKLEQFQQFFNEHRSHMGLDGDTPNQISDNKKSMRININNFRWKSHCKGLFQLPIAV